MRLIVLFIIIGSSSHLAMAFGDFPLSSCKGWNATITEKAGINTSRAIMKGINTRADIEEYCERDPGGITRQYGGKLTIRQCVDTELASSGNDIYLAIANCDSGQLTLSSRGKAIREVRFPLEGKDGEEPDTSCASGNPPLIKQFRILCPRNARRWGVNED